jgi:hypothetical protein
VRDRIRAIRERTEGQTIVFVAVSMVVLIGITGFALDIGHAYFVQRELQRSADAAALAAALDLPDESNARATAHAYSAEDGAKNEATSVTNARTTITLKCLKLQNPKPFGCKATDSPPTYNTVQVRQDANVPTFFARVLGIDSLDVHATATACSPCGGGKPVDIMLVVDRTGSMCQVWDPVRRRLVDDRANGCTDLKNAQNGMKAFLKNMDPDYHSVGLAVLPPAASPSAKCNAPSSPYYTAATNGYVLAPLSNDYLDASSPDGLNSSSPLVSTINCLKTNGNTSYATAIAMAQDTLQRTGRPDAVKVIIFLSDGAANTTPPNTPYYPSLSPCRQGVAVADDVTNAGTRVYAIGYDLDGGTNAPEQCQPRETPAYSSLEAMTAIASDPTTFYQKDEPGNLSGIFTSIATDVSRISSRLIADSAS